MSSERNIEQMLRRVSCRQTGRIFFFFLNLVSYYNAIYMADISKLAQISFEISSMRKNDKIGCPEVLIWLLNNSYI